jgi:PAS domain S-box-containing protein/putative nucleotidyltransferase with HDIG domain
MEVALDAIPDAIAWTDAMDRIQWCNESFAKLTGQPAILVLGKNLLKQIPLLDSSGQSIHQYVHPVSMVHAGQSPASGIFEYRQAEKALTLEVTASYMQSTGKESPIIIIFHDITKRKQVENVALEYTERVRLLLDSTAEAIHGLDLDGNCTFANAACIQMLGYSHESELLGRNMHRLIHHTRPDGTPAPLEECHIFQTVQQGKSYHVDDEVLWRKNGTSFPAAYWSYPVHKEGKVAGAVVTFMDISDKIRVREALEKSYMQLRASLEGTIAAITRAVEARDPYTAGHQRRVAELASAIAQKTGLDKQQIEGVRLGASIHDIGKINVPAEFLTKPTRLTKGEFEIIKTHPEVGYDILKDIEFPWPVAEIAHQHHEHLDGSGYPQGLKGSKMVYEAKIVAVADVVEAMSSHRPYRPGLGIDMALKEIEDHRGTFYDPGVVDICLDLFRSGKFSFASL